MWPVPAVSLRPEFYYALMRAGLPASTDSLFRVSPATVEAIWSQAAAHGIIPAGLAQEVPSAVQSFQAISAAHALIAPPPMGISTLQEMVAPALAAESQRQQFAQLYTQYQGNWSKFWPAVDQRFGTATRQQLQLMGQLYYLTINNQPLVSALTAAEPAGALSSPQDLAALGYYDPAKWEPLVGGNVPPQIPGATPAEQAGNYAKLLAAQVRLAFPTAVLADQVRRGLLPLTGDSDTAGLVAGFLAEHQGEFEIGVEPVEAYLARTGLASPPAPVVTQVKRLQRAYQLTPDDTSLPVLLSHNLDSAFAITRYDSGGFVRAFSGSLGGSEVAAAIHARARQIFTATLSVAVAYLGARVSPNFGGLSPVQDGFPPAQAGPDAYPVVAYPTLENLFGSLDYCDCPDCGSILSPAAYLVDLLNHIDQPAPAAGPDNPQDALLQRRPDLQYLPLTCANTNTALPYIDIVNETLEYFVANGLSLDGYQGHDTGDAVTSAELLASPQYVNDAAYATLRDAFFPPPLPFSRPLALLRLHLQHLGIALPDAMAALRAGDQLVNHATPASYGWSDILIEQASISRDEYRLFTDPALQLGDLYGLPDGTALASLQTMSLQDFSRRLSVSYDDLSLIVATRFINPNAALIPRLLQLNAPFTTLKNLHDNPATAAQFISALPAGLDATQYGGTGPADYQAVVNWVTGPKVYPLIMDIITISDADGSSGDCSGAGLQLRYSNPDNTSNLLSGTDFLKLIRFIRLWRKLAPLLSGSSDAASIQHTDDIIAALYPAADLPAGTSNTANDPANAALLDTGFQVLLGRLGFLLRVMSQLSLTGKGLDQLLACWAPIGTIGPGSLYRAMFLTPTLLQQDPGAQTATVASTVNVGDVLHTGINTAPGQPGQVNYTVASADTAATAAAAIAAAINAATTADPATGLPLNQRFYATSAGGVITIKAGFTLACSVSAAGTETYTAAAASPLSQSAAVAGTVTPGDTLTTTIDGVPIGYTVLPGDTPATIAAGIAAAINAATIQDPYSGLPLNDLVVASSTAAVVTIITANAGPPFSLTCSLTPANAGTYSATPPVPPSWTATVTGAVAPGDTLVTTVNSVAVSYTAQPADTGAATLAASIAAVLSAAVQPDPVTGLPLGAEIRAAAAGGVITITSVDPAAPVTLACSVTTGAETYLAAGPFPQTATATVAGTIPAGAMLTTSINTLPVAYQAAPGDTATSIATAIAAAVNATNTPDPVTCLPLNTVVTTTAAGGVITFTAAGPATTFTLDAALTAGGYTAGRHTPPFADDGYGDFLADPAQTLFGHQPTLCAAFNLTGAEFTLITTALGFDPSTPLTLANVSAVFRYGWLAHTLGLSVLEFLNLREFTGLDPFAPLDPGTTPPTEPTVVRFIRLLQAYTAAGLTNAQALYLMWNQDISGTSAPPSATVTGLASTLRASFAAVEAQFALRDDPDGSIAQSLMTLVYGAAASAFFFGLLNNTFSTSAGYSTPPGQPSLPAPVVAAAGGRLSYNDVTKQLTFSGVLDPATQATIDAATSDPQLTAAIARLEAASQQAVGPFFAGYPELLPLYQAYVASGDPATVKRQALLDGFLPILKARRKQEQALASVTAAAGTGPSFAAALLGDPAILHADAAPTAAAAADLTAVEAPGLSAAFFLGNNPAAPPDQTADTVPVLAYTQTATVGGTVTTGDTLTTTIDSTAIGYTVAPGDTLATIATGIAAAINATAPVNRAVSASAAGSVITMTGLDPSGATSYFTLATAVSGGATETYAAGRQLPGSGPIAAVWDGYITVPQDGGYDISIAAGPGAGITLLIGGSTVAGNQAGGLWRSTSPVSLVAGALTRVTLTATSIGTTLSVSWRSLGLGWEIIPGQYLYSGRLISRLSHSYLRFLKAASLASALSLTAAEITWLGTAPGYSGPPEPAIGSGWLNFLAADGAPAPATAASLAGVLTALVDFARIKQALSPGDERLLAVLQDPAATLPDGQNQSALLSLTGWAQLSVNALLTLFFGSTDPASLSSVENFRRVYDAYSIARTAGLTAPALISAITNAPSATTVGALQSALRARYAEADWLTVVRPINDAARILQRDALVAYILQKLGDGYAQSTVALTTSAPAATGDTTLSCASTAGVSAGMLVRGAAIAPGTSVTAVTAGAVTISAGLLAALPAGSPLVAAPAGIPFDHPDCLYEYFLIDTQTQPPVETSRIRLALSAVQLFIERVIRSLEPQVAASDIDLAQWEWMKRYRVWQANREVFLWPENWLYPELRDDQSPFFQQMMSSLLQSDITDDAAVSAYLDYLTSLEEVAKLEPCGLYYQPGTADADEASHVLARTAGGHRKHYFRQLQADGWTPWTQVKIDCEDMPVTPIVWNGRLFLFWLRIVKQSQPQQPDLSTANVTPAVQGNQIATLQISDLQSYGQAGSDAQAKGSVTASAVLCWTEFYNGKWQPPKTSDVNLPTAIGTFDPTGPGSVEAARDQIRIVPAQLTGTDPTFQYDPNFTQFGFQLTSGLPPGDALLLAITGTPPVGGFLLHNTHSLPIRFEDINVTFGIDPDDGNLYPTQIPLGDAIDVPVPGFPGRSLSPAPATPWAGGLSSGTFAVNYLQNPGNPIDGPPVPAYSNSILEYNWLARFTEPQPGLPDAWDAPFIYEDRRNVFYVTTTEKLVTIWEFEGFGLLPVAQQSIYLGNQGPSF
ncbi:MAG TPA: neuraminidase-like domain-containing protein [Streptosporangiaceae bacterium]|nr:neuraminidase-like domain-containing protein [Streptosporangiaceae bacterium]